MPKTDTSRPISLADYRPPAYLVDAVRLDVNLHPTQTRVRARIDVNPNPAAGDKPGPLVLDGETLHLDEVRLNGTPLAKGGYKVGARTMTVPSVPQRPFSLEIATVVDPDGNKALQGLYRSRGMYTTQCEAQGFRRITYFPDRPDVLSKYITRIEAGRDEAAVLLGNGNPAERGTAAHGRHYAVWHDPFPKPSYLFALVGGNLAHVADTFTTMSGRRVALGIYVEPGKEDRAAWAMDALKRAMRWDEVRFGREYDLDVFNIVAVSDFNMGAMENKGLNIFNDRLILASPATATDGTYEAIEAVVAHEYFHNWTGNRITCRDWFQLCLKEGLTVYRDQEFSADERSRTVQRIAGVRQLRAFQFSEDAGPLAHPVRPERYIEINNFYTATVYEKGAELVRMLEIILGADDFRRGMDLYFERHDGQAVTVEDFVQCFADAGGRDLDQFMVWYKQAGTPQLVCALEYDRETRIAELTVTQEVPPTPGESKKKPLHIPVRMGLIGGNGQDLPLRLDSGEDIDGGVLHLRKRTQTFRFVDVPSRPIPSLLRGFSAPARLALDLSDRDLQFLMANDSDLFNRWQAANDFATRILVQSVRAKTAGKTSSRGVPYARALGQAIGEERLEPAYRAELLRLPTEADIARDIGANVDPSAIHWARRRLMRLIGTTLGPALEDIYRDAGKRGAFSPDAASAGRRALRNTALTLLHERGTPADLTRTTQHYRRAATMTEQAHALFLLAAHRGPGREQALDHFFERWKDDHVVIDMWFSAQACSPLPATVARVHALTKHPLFSLAAPNKVRSLIGSFSAGNPVQFNRADGTGYNLVVDHVLALDRFNPQIAARLLGAFCSWRNLEPGRRKLARKALKRVAADKDLSRDSTEIVSKILD
ncbi:MAG: aminopeptidase N [Hyphomicrobiaceae bacterium]